MPRTSRKGGSTSAAHTPMVSEPRASRPPSPLSPSRISRIGEKHEMQNLNDRLATYIDRVRTLEFANNVLNKEISSIEETKSTEVVTMRKAYDSEMSQLRKALDATSKDKSRFEMENDKLAKENRELRNKLKEKEKAYDSASRDLKGLSARVATLQSDWDSASRELNELRPEVARLTKKLEDAKRNLEDETLKRVDLQNQLQTNQENWNFQNQLLEQQLNESRIRKQIEISEIDGKLNKDYDDKLQRALADAREGFHRDLAHQKAEFSKLYEDKLKNLKEKLENERINNAGSFQEMREMETKVTGLTSRNMELESMSASLNARISQLMQEIDDMGRNHRGEMTRKDAEIRAKEQEYEDLVRDFEELMEVKVGLDMEILAYKKMLEGEEERLGMSGSSSPMASFTTPAGRGVKRKRTTIVEEDMIQMSSDHSGTGEVTIQPFDKDSKYISIKNTSDEDVNIGGWTLSNTTDDGQDATYKFHRNITLHPDDECKIYSADSEETHAPPLSLVMKRGGWTIGDSNTTTLVNKEGDEVSERTSKKERALVGSTSYGTSQMYSSSRSEDGQEKCAIM